MKSKNVFRIGMIVIAVVFTLTTNFSRKESSTELSLISIGRAPQAQAEYGWQDWWVTYPDLYSHYCYHTGIFCCPDWDC